MSEDQWLWIIGIIGLYACVVLRGWASTHESTRERNERILAGKRYKPRPWHGLGGGRP